MPSCATEILVLYIKQLFEIVDSPGSIFGESINLFLSFQKSSATHSFITRFPIKTRNMFRWASNIVQMLSDKLANTPFNAFDLFQLYSLVFPLFILSFITALVMGFWFCIGIFIYALFLLLGVGLGYIGIDKSVVLGCCIPVAAVVALMLMGWLCSADFSSCCKRKQQVENESTDDIKEDDDEEVKQQEEKMFFYDGPFRFIIALLPAIVILVYTMYSITMYRYNLGTFIAIFSLSILALTLIIELILYYGKCKCIKTFDSNKYIKKIIIFLAKVLSLLIIPSTENFIDMMKEDYENKWGCILGYVVVSLILPIGIDLIFILTKHIQTINDYKFREGFNFYPYIELIDTLKQIGYSVSAAFDIPSACIAIECVWIVFILILRPYAKYSEYPSNLGQSLCSIIANSIAVHHANTGQQINFAGATTLVILNCLPSISSHFIFYIFDFEVDIRKVEKEETISFSTLGTITLWSILVSPFAWFVYGVNFPNIVEKND